MVFVTLYNWIGAWFTMTTPVNDASAATTTATTTIATSGSAPAEHLVMPRLPSAEASSDQDNGEAVEPTAPAERADSDDFGDFQGA